MIGSIEGKVSWKDERSMIVATNGVGYCVFTTPALRESLALGDTLSLFTHLAVKDDALDLYGFRDISELGLFRMLIGISGIGPKSALSVLALADTVVITRAIASGDSGYLTTVSGIGKKLAEKIVHELRDKVIALTPSDVPVSAESEAIEALSVLGYPAKETREVVRMLAQTHETTETIIHQALKQLGARSK